MVNVLSYVIEQIITGSIPLRNKALKFIYDAFRFYVSVEEWFTCIVGYKVQLHKTCNGKPTA